MSGISMLDHFTARSLCPWHFSSSLELSNKAIQRFSIKYKSARTDQYMLNKPRITANYRLQLIQIIDSEFKMMRGVERDYSEFTHLKEDACAKVTQQNATQMLDGAKDQIMKKLQKLDVNNITGVEDLYLIVAQLTHAASYVAAINKAERKRTSFDDEIESIGLDDIAPILLDTFKDQPQTLNLAKIHLIDDTHKPSKQAWAGLHCRMVLVANATKAHHVMAVLKDNIPTYKSHLENKLKENGVVIPPPKEMHDAPPTIIKKLVTRYQAVSDIENRIKDKESLNEIDMKFVKEKIKICLDHKPDWSERPFLQKLTDVLSFGIKPLYRAFFSKEKELQKTLEQSITPK